MLRELFMQQLDVDEDVAAILVQEGFSSIEEIAYVPQSEIASIEEFDEAIVQELRNRARDVLLTQAIASEETVAAPAADLLEVEGMDGTLAVELARHGIVTREDLAEQAIIQWGHPDWTFIEKPGDLAGSLEKLAQATLNANQIAFQRPQLLVSRLGEAQGIWARAGQSPPQADLNQLVDGRFALGSSKDSRLFSTEPPANNTFLLTAKVDLPQLSAEEQQNAQEVVKLPLEKIDFEPESTRLTAKASEDLTAQVLPVLRSSRLYLKIEGSAAWPGPPRRAPT